MTITDKRRLLLVALGFGLTSCATDSHHYFHEEERPHAAEWGYAGDIGPARWGDLCPDYVLAKAGKQQSPIDLSGATGSNPPITFDYHSAPIDLVYNGHTIQETEDRHSSITVSGKKYVLQQFHFHAPSEHTIEGAHAAMEMHLVHQADDGEVAVVGVMIDAGDENHAFGTVWSYLPTDENRANKPANMTVDAAELLPAEHGYYGYMGSFTTPPCTEGVLWMVLKAPIEMSPAQIETFRAVIHDNNRPVQPLNGRRITLTRS